jgi:hypothetical protein
MFLPAVFFNSALPPGKLRRGRNRRRRIFQMLLAGQATQA